MILLFLLAVAAAWYLLASVATFAAYGYDKHKARFAGRRVTERTLHTMELAGGWPGAMAAQRRFKHKWRKREYMLVFRLIIVVHAMAWALLLFLWWVL